MIYCIILYHIILVQTDLSPVQYIYVCVYRNTVCNVMFVHIIYTGYARQEALRNISRITDDMHLMRERAMTDAKTYRIMQAARLTYYINYIMY